MGEKLLIDSTPIRLQMIESAEGGKVIARGEFARGDKSTSNNRYYRTSLWERSVNSLTPKIKERMVFGELDHPADGRTQLKRCSHIVTDLRLEDGVVIGEAEILDTAAGRDLKALLKSGAKVGVSSRGYGSTQTNERGEEVVQDDYRLVTFDFVADPANQTSYPEVYHEEKKPEMTAKKESDPAKLKEEFAKVAQQIFAEEREKIREEEKAKLLSDPEAGADKKIVESLKELLRDRVLPEDANVVLSDKEKVIEGLRAESAEKDLKIQALQEQVEELSKVAKEVGYKYFLEQAIAGDEHADSIRALVGDVALYESHDQLVGALEGARTEISQQRQLILAEEKQRERERRVFENDLKRLQEKTEKLEEALEKSSKLNNLLTLEVYAERSLEKHPKAAEIRKVIESSKPESRQEVDEIIESFAERASDREDRDAVRARIRSIVPGGQAPSAIDEETGASEGGDLSEDENYNNLGVSLTELKRLAG